MANRRREAVEGVAFQYLACGLQAEPGENVSLYVIEVCRRPIALAVTVYPGGHANGTHQGRAPTLQSMRGLRRVPTRKLPRTDVSMRIQGRTFWRHQQVS